MSQDDGFSRIQSKIERGSKHVLDLERTIKEFLNSKPFTIETTRHPTTRRLIYYVTDVQPVPRDSALIAGDALQNFRSALDHLAFELHLKGSNREQSVDRRIYFPIAESAEKLRDGLRRQVGAAPQEAVDAIIALEPYRGGKGHQLWMLNELNVIDKHRTLMTVGSVYRSVNVGPRIMRDVKTKMNQMLKETSKGPVKFPDVNLFLMPKADMSFPLKTGDRVFEDLPD